MSIDQSFFRRVMGQFASGVTVVTTAVGDELQGMTVSSFASLSMEPMLVLICIACDTASHESIQRSGMFAVNMLTEEQEHLSQRFASRDVDKFLSGSYTFASSGLPLLNDALATIECRVVNALPGGDHTIFVGEILNASVGHGRPLVYYGSGYYRLG
ncbi:MAG: flavin reductase family protein [Chloroflexales bacterium]|nr:flavin reductase family protein [Chloroflexales bacterium]